MSTVKEDADRHLLLLAGQKEVFEQIARGEPLAAVLDGIVRFVERALSGGGRASVLLLDERGTRLLHGAAPSLPGPYNQAIHGVAIGEGVGSCGTAAHRGEPVVVADIATDPLWADFRELAAEHGLVACWSMPVHGGDGGVLGTFAVYPGDARAPSAEELAVLSAFAPTAAVAIERDRDARRIQREKRSAEALEVVGRAIAGRLELGEIVQQATDAATELTGARFGAFFYNVIGEDGAAYQLYTLSGVPREAFERFPMPRATQIFAPTFNGEAPVRLADVTADPRYGQNPPRRGMPDGHLPVRSYLALPVKTARGEVLGGLFFGHPEPDVFDAENERVAVGIAAHAAIAIENARLYEASRRAYEERDRVARTLQESLLPPHVPSVLGLDVAARYHAAGRGTDVVGDFYDLFEHGPDRCSVVIGDVCGKGVRAAKMTALARYTVRAAAMRTETPAEVLQTLNLAALAGRAEHGLFLTAIYADIRSDGPGVRAELCCSGHPPALVVRAGGRVEASGRHGPLLGVFEDIDTTSEAVRLGPGDALVFVTDGVIEARRHGTLFGEERLAEVLAARAGADSDTLVAAVVDAVVAHAGETFADDVAILALRVPSAPSGPAPVQDGDDDRAH